MNIKCLKLVCSKCQKSGLAQMFLNNAGSIRYARVRHYSHNDSATHKPQFTYCKLEDLESLKDLLKSEGISLNTDRAIKGQLGQSDNKKIRDQEDSENSLNQQNKSGCRLVWFRTLAFQANDPGFKSRRPHQILLIFHACLVVRLLVFLEAHQAN
jgi:hypothetical protein